jgi:membrane protein DedA with SNARE-associated domain
MDAEAQLALSRYKKFLMLTFGAIVLACGVGGLGGWLLYENHEGGKILGAYLLWPTVVAAIGVVIPLRVLRKRWFPTKESLEAAASLMAASAKE